MSPTGNDPVGLARSAEDVPVKHDISYLLRICSVAALGGLLFGYDTSVVSGAIEPLRIAFGLSAAETGWAVSNVVVGCIFGAMMAGFLANRFGRRITLFLCALLFTVQSVGAALAPDFFWFVVYRLTGGIAVGIASVVSPMYMSEVSPKNMRGRAVSMNNFAIIFGQIVVFIVNYLIARSATEAWLHSMGWRWMFASEVVPCVLFCAVIFFIPESPRWLMLIGREERAKKALTRISNEKHALELMGEIRESINEAIGNKKVTLRELLNDFNARWLVFVGFMIAGCQQIMGVNVMMYYAPMVLKSSSGDMVEALFQTIWIGVAQLIGNAIGVALVDRKGRRPLIAVGSVGVILSLLVVSWSMYMKTGTGLMLTGMLAYMVFFGMSWAPLAWTLVSEIFPNRCRGLGMSIACSSNWIFNFTVAQSFPMLNENPWLLERFHGAFSMWLFAGLGLFSFWFVMRFVPETNGVSLEKIEETMMRYAPGRRREGRA
ncbi:sugar porter family MFS transporter [Brenneria izadpanahii]|uniref:Sugar porter family MFS transporter n=1 Tax=Brenneria izadpanahii TaxID=2722756 RepID=A0ABX7UUE2_9GAMM|nr:sugar porter family MFS transporter [Brenneria izadpanahii]QTF09000.1 sugar porter family MFS transporter [Brenneria izadpanahii]